MKLVINRCYGGFSIGHAAKKELGVYEELQTNPYRNDTDFRADKNLIKLIEEKGSYYVSGVCAELEVVEIPDSATDYTVIEYDGVEDVLYVVDGKIYFLSDE